MSKRTLDSFFKTAASSSKKPKATTSNLRHEEVNGNGSESLAPSHHPSYPIAIAGLPSHVATGLSTRTPGRPPRTLSDHANLDLLYFEPYIPQPTAREYFQFLRRELPFYRVRYTIRRGPTETVVSTPRFTTVFGVDATSYFSSDEKHQLLDSKTDQPVKADRYKCKPRPIPACLDLLRQQVEVAMADGTTYNFCLVNYYASGDDSISYHSDDERFLGSNPNIASLSLGAKRDFLMKHKPPPASKQGPAPPVEDSGETGKPLKLPLASGDMIVMRGETQANWLHRIPKRKSGEAGNGRINITFRKAVVSGGTENYYHYNVGSGEMYRWNDKQRKLMLAREVKT
jgi:alkylated DNA repair dioxygenase AlkB